MIDIPSYALYGETHDFPDVIHCERITDRAQGLDWVIKPHRHGNLHQFFLLDQGNTRFSLDGVDYHFTGPTVISIPPHHVHGFHFAPNTVGFVLSCPAAIIRNFTQTDPDLGDIGRMAYTGHATMALADAFGAIHREYQLDAPARPSLLRAQVLALLCHLARQPKLGDMGKTSHRAKFDQFQSLLNAQPEVAVNITELAQNLGLSRSQLHRVCQSVAGQSAHRIAMQSKIQEAKRRLAYTRESAAEIAYRLGFDDPSYFSKVFRKETGQTPSDYRRPFFAGGD